MKATLCENPFDRTRGQRELLLLPAETVGQALERDGLPDVDGRYVISCNGELLPPERALAYVPQAGDDLTVVCWPANSTLRTIALVGVAVAAAAFSGGLGGIIASTIGVSAHVGAAIAGALISIGGSLLVNGIASLFQKTPGGANYGVLGPSTTARSGIPIPKGFGLFQAGCNIVESWIDIQGNNEDAHDVDDGADTIGRQYINCRFDFGWGPARSITNIQLNGKDIEEYADVAYCLRYGTNDQEPVSSTDPGWVVINRTTTGDTINSEPTADFNTLNNNYPVSQRVRAGIARNYVIVPGQRADTEKLTVYVVFPDGVWRYDDSMVIKRLAIDYDVYYRRAGSGDAWISTPHHYYYNIRQTILRQATIIDNLTPGCWDVKVVKNGSGAVDNPLDHFEHESNMFGDELWIESVQETSYTALAYPNMIQICLRYMATDQLSGSDVNLTAQIEYGLRNALPAPLTGLPESCPAAIAYDILKDDVIGADLDDSRIDLDFFAAWAALTEQAMDDGDGGTVPLARFNGIFDQDAVNIWQALQTVAVMSRANLQRVGRKVTGWLDQPDVPVQLFHVGNILADSYSKNYLGLDDRAEEIEVSFADAADSYKTRNPCRVVRAADESSEDALKKTRATLLGCTDRVQAFYWAILKLRENEEVLRTHTWQSNAQAIRCRTGNVVLLQHDVPQWGWGGLLQPGSTVSVLQLDRTDLPFETGTTYTIIVIHPALLRMGITITAIVGNVLTVTGYDGTTPIQRLLQGGSDVAVKAVTSTTVTVADATGLVTGAAALWDLDVMETRTVSALAGAEATLSAPLSAVPVDYAGYVFQSTAKQAIPIRIRSMKKRIGEQRYTLTGQDTSDEMYDLPAPVGIAGGATGGGPGGGGPGGGGGDPTTSLYPTVSTDTGETPTDNVEGPQTGDFAIVSALGKQFDHDVPGGDVNGSTHPGSANWSGWSGIVTGERLLVVEFFPSFSGMASVGEPCTMSIFATGLGGSPTTLMTWDGNPASFLPANPVTYVLPVGFDLSALHVEADVSIPDPTILIGDATASLGISVRVVE